ncbi:unnamed protein product [Psylliodes chrysocephalus]|uniref:non-specific protein-tyrosine kinase n=1 Tax=Psylliodes chrysocephalus TaxID=3402493 RepID=A0A9P0CRE2_9CUCU|nr:unnamed protein product [Psylliodes chrysocephala]
MGDHLAVNIVLDSKCIAVPYNKTTTAEDVCIYICKQLNIGSLTRHLFALRVSGKTNFLMPAATFSEKPVPLDFRMRFKVANIIKLRNFDQHTYNYYFHQARTDVLDNKIPDIIYEKHRSEIVGLGITDMYRVMLEKDISKEAVENDYKKYFPKEVLKRHPFFMRKPIRDHLTKLSKSVYDASYVKTEYLKQLESIAPEYLIENYKACVDQEGSIYNIYLKVNPYHSTEPGIRYCIDPKKGDWQLICSIEDVVFVSIRADNTTEISRKTGIPFYLKFDFADTLRSFISLLDGYYRLTCKWTFNICKDVYTPSLQKLHAMKCHGPVGGEFSYAKLEEKRANRPGCFIIRESESSRYNDYYIDVCMKDSLKPKTFKLEKITGNEFIFNDDVKKYKSIQDLKNTYNDLNGPIYLQECLPPSEYDISPLLLCRIDNIEGDSLTDSSVLNALSMPTMPLCINCKKLQVYKGQKREGSRAITVVFRSMWIITKGKKIEVAMKVLKQDYADKYLKDFLSLAGQWAFLQSSAIVRLFGIAFTSNISLVLEYYQLGALDLYLRKNKQNLKPVDLIEAASNLASALWHLTENRIIHGNIRCRKLMVASHDDNSFTVKLTDPGIHTEYASSEVHWIPVECYTKLDLAKMSTEADVWSFGTTIWEIYMYGEEIKPIDHLQAMRSYQSGERLPQPSSCSNEMYILLKECWDKDPHKRKKPQAILRDINQILYEVYNSRRTHTYAKVFSKIALQNVLGASSISLNSNQTECTNVPYPDDSDLASECSDKPSISGSPSLRDPNFIHNFDDSYDWTNIISTTTATTSLDSLNSMQSVFELDDNYNVVLQGRIGQGFYGEVFKGTLESVDGLEEEPKRVAVKKLKTFAESTCLQDFEREINIMKSLEHPNIVKIIGVQRESEILLVMEFVPHGSLQSYLKINRESLQEAQLLNYALDIAKGMDYLGKEKIVHRDLAARNILVVDENHVKISDFGLAQVMSTDDYYYMKTPNRELPIKWFAPESLRDGKFSVRSDVWSYGVTMCEMFNYGEEPVLANVTEKIDEGVPQQQALLTALEGGARFPCPPKCPRAVYVRIIHPCWETNPHKRPLFSAIAEEIQELISH